MLNTVLSILLWIIPAVWIAFAWWSWRFVRRNELRDAYLPMRRIPGVGMGILGLGMWLYVSLTQAMNEVRGVPLADALGMGRFWSEMALALAIGYPLWIWGDFLFRRWMMWFLRYQGRRAPPPSTAAE